MKFRYLEVKLYKIYLDDTEAFIKAMDEDYFKEDVFEFCHPLDKKKLSFVTMFFCQLMATPL